MAQIGRRCFLCVRKSCDLCGEPAVAMLAGSMQLPAHSSALHGRKTCHLSPLLNISTLFTSSQVDFPRLAATLVEAAASDDEFTRLTALKWLKVFISLAAPALAPQFASLLGALLPNMAHSSKDIAQVGGCGCGCGTLDHIATDSPSARRGLTRLHPVKGVV